MTIGLKDIGHVRWRSLSEIGSKKHKLYNIPMKSLKETWKKIVKMHGGVSPKSL